MVIQRNSECHAHSRLDVEIRTLNSDMRQIKRKLDRVEKLLWALVVSLGSGAAAMGLSPQAAQAVVAAIVP